MTITLGKLRTFEYKWLTKILETKDKFAIKKFLDEWGLEVRDKKILPRHDCAKVWKDLYAYYDKLQLVKKINLNSALLENCAFN